MKVLKLNFKNTIYKNTNLNHIKGCYNAQHY